MIVYLVGAEPTVRNVSYELRVGNTVRTRFAQQMQRGTLRLTHMDMDACLISLCFIVYY